ncbi:glycosyltransferase [Pseudomonas putida]
MSWSSRAREAFRSGHYQEAVDLYERAIVEQPELASSYHITLDIARKQSKLHDNGAQKIAVVHLPLEQHRHLNEIIQTDEDCIALHLEDLYQKVSAFAQAVKPLEDYPLVSILMTTRNAVSHIEESVTSALSQNWPNLELIVIDDFSDDGTWEILKRLQNSVGNLTCRRVNTNLGCGFAQNYALNLARGEFVFFQKGNDLSHPQRVRLSMQQLMRSTVACVRGSLSHVQFTTGRVMTSSHILNEFDPTLVGYRRALFSDIGPFNCTDDETDREFCHRLIACIDNKGMEFLQLDLPLHYRSLNEFSAREHHEFPTPEVDSIIAQQPMASSAQSTDTRTPYHEPFSAERLREILKLPVVKSAHLNPGEISLLSDPAQRVVVSLCSIPERAELLHQVLSSLAPQVDNFHIYLDRYDSIPNFIRDCHPHVTVYLSKDHPGLRDNGKFLAFAALSEDCYYFTADDDIIYPPDYVASMIRRIEGYGRQAVIGVHGVLLPEQAEGYFSSYRKVHMFKKELERDALVNNLGTGTVAFHSSLLRGLDLSHFGTPGMADLHLSVFCKQRNVPMVTVARPDDWLQELPCLNTSLYNEFRLADDAQSALIRSHKPWGYAAISQAVAGASERANCPEVSDRLQQLIPILHACLK